MGKTANVGQIESIKGSKIWPIQEGQKVLTEVEIYQSLFGSGKKINLTL